ncbi:MAG: D-alanyl-D-alanine carboxypeptidase [Caloramator sp.]|nr:D-alanyl-D-alanine carboxypeptidase [Caloramator sp.]
MLKKVISLSIVFLILFYPLKSHADTLNVAAKGCLLMDLDSGKILYSKNINERFAPASTTKIMTALITLEKCNLNEKVIVGKKPPYEDGSKIYLLEGEELTIEQLLYAMMLESANDAALALAEHISGSKENFAKLMNEKAIELGCKNTNFVNPNGLYDNNHYTSAADLAIITRKAMENPVFRKIVATKFYQLPPTNKQPQKRYFHNHNKLLATRGYKYEGADGVKTGYTIKANHSFVGSATKNNMHLLTVFLNSDKSYYADSKKLFDYGFKNYITKKVLNKDEPFTQINIDNNTSIPVFCEKNYYVTFKNSENINIDKNVVLNSSFKSIKKGQVVGYVELFYDNYKDKVNLIAMNDYNGEIYKVQSNKNGDYKKILPKKYIYIPILTLSALFLSFGFLKKRKIRSGKI